MISSPNKKGRPLAVLFCCLKPRFQLSAFILNFYSSFRIAGNSSTSRML